MLQNDGTERSVRRNCPLRGAGADDVFASAFAQAACEVSPSAPTSAKACGTSHFRVARSYTGRGVDQWTIWKIAVPPRGSAARCPPLRNAEIEDELFELMKISFCQFAFVSCKAMSGDHQFRIEAELI